MHKWYKGVRVQGYNVNMFNLEVLITIYTVTDTAFKMHVHIYMSLCV